MLPLPVDQAFTYSVPESLRARAAVGMRVVVPVKTRVETGYIVGLSNKTDVRGVRDLIDLPDETPMFSPALLKLCRWMADYYCCSWGEALQCALPPGVQVHQKFRYQLVTEQLSSGRFTDRQRKLVAALHRRGPLTEGQLSKEVGRGALSNTLQSLVKRGVLVAEPVASRSGVSAQTETYVQLVEDAVPDAEALAKLQRRAPRQAAVYLDLLNGEPERAATTLYEKHKVNAAILKALEDKGLIAREEREFYRTPDIATDAGAAVKHRLNDEQQAAYDDIDAAMAAKKFQTYLLRGITGSGKTEVYLQAIERALELGRDAIVLVPEISLTPQTVGRFKARFQESIAVMHSGLATGERYDEWRRAQRGEVRIVVGARSAIFAPLANLGVVIVDEEHDTSYKQGEAPRYHARDVAIMRAKLCDGVCVLGSATPSIESYYNSTSGKSARLDLFKRATNAKLPEVQLVDMRIEAKEQKGEIILSRTLEDEVTQRVKAKEQVILLLNRRGFSPFVLCPQCSWVAECEDCNVTMTYHAKGAFLACHYCNATRDIPVVCDSCHFNPLIYLGTGTQKVEEYLMQAFPGAKVERMDADTTAGKGGHAKILGRFAAGEIDILIGTQMIAKGHDYPGVTLVGVINADTGLSMPDFRAAENTFQLLTQVAGRAGRGDLPGRVVIQTYRPKHYAIQAATGHDYAAFFEEERTHRETAGYPPYRRMANLALEAEDAQHAERGILQVDRLLRKAVAELGYPGIEILGPAPAAVRRVKKKYRWNIGVLSKSAARINAIVRTTRDAFDSAPKVGKPQLKVDLDPYGMF